MDGRSGHAYNIIVVFKPSGTLYEEIVACIKGAPT